jgi:hypothetical protein
MTTIVWLILFKDSIAVYSGKHMKYVGKIQLFIIRACSGSSSSSLFNDAFSAPQST